jgi:hypothetical protein
LHRIAEISAILIRSLLDLAARRTMSRDFAHEVWIPSSRATTLAALRERRPRAQQCAPERMMRVLDAWRSL